VVDLLSNNCTLAKIGDNTSELVLSDNSLDLTQALTSFSVKFDNLIKVLNKINEDKRNAEIERQKKLKFEQEEQERKDQEEILKKQQQEKEQQEQEQQEKEHAREHQEQALLEQTEVDLVTKDTTPIVSNQSPIPLENTNTNSGELENDTSAINQSSQNQDTNYDIDIEEQGTDHQELNPLKPEDSTDHDQNLDEDEIKTKEENYENWFIFLC